MKFLPAPAKRHRRLVQNVATTANVAMVFETGQPLIERIITVTGRGIREPGNWVIPFGTKLRDVIEACGGLTDDAAEIVFGGPMMGQSQASLDVPILKATGGILILSEGRVQAAGDPALHPLRKMPRGLPDFPESRN